MEIIAGDSVPLDNTVTFSVSAAMLPFACAMQELLLTVRTHIGKIRLTYVSRSICEELARNRNSFQLSVIVPLPNSLVSFFTCWDISSDDECMGGS
jgi:hypothetical protein